MTVCEEEMETTLAPTRQCLIDETLNKRANVDVRVGDDETRVKRTD